MPGIVKQPDPTALEPFPKGKDGVRHGFERGVRVKEDLELQVFEHSGHILSVMEGIRQRRRVLIRGIPDD
jgi:hypothetical protein